MTEYNQDRYPEPYCHDHPVEHLEPEKPNEYREAAKAYMRIVSLALTFVLDADDPLAAAVSVSYALGLTSVVGERTMADYARDMGVSKATLSALAKKFARSAGLPPSALLRPQRDVETLREARNNKLK